MPPLRLTVLCECRGSFTKRLCLLTDEGGAAHRKCQVREGLCWPKVARAVAGAGVCRRRIVEEVHRGGGDVWTRLERWVGLGGRAGRPGWACSTVRSRRGSPAARHISERTAPISPNAPRPPAALLRGHVALDAPSPHACGSDLPWTWP